MNKSEIQSKDLEAKVLYKSKKYKKAYINLSVLLESYDLQKYLDNLVYIDTLLIYRDLCYRYKRDVVARTTEEEIIRALFPARYRNTEIYNLDYSNSKNPDYSLQVVNEIANTHKTKNIFSKKQNTSIQPVPSAMPEISTNLSYQNNNKINRDKFSKFFWPVAILLFFVWVFFGDYLYVTYKLLGADPDIIRIANNSGFNTKGKSIFLSNNPELVGPDRLNEVCPNNVDNTIEYGCYDPKNNKIYILRVPDPSLKSIEYVTAAHEMLHSAWFDLSQSERSKIAKELNDYVSNKSKPFSQEISEILAKYPQQKEVLESELHSFAGSQFSGISSEYYIDYFDDTTAGYTHKKDFDAKIQSINIALDAKVSALDALANEINNFKANYIYPFERAYYLDDYNYNVYSNNIKIVNDKINRYNQLLNEYNAEASKAQQTFDQFLPNSKRKTKQPTVGI